MRRLIFLLVLVAILTGCDAGPSGADTASSANQSLTVESGEVGDPSHWTALSDAELWEHIAALDSTVTVGLKEPGERRGVDLQGRAMLPKVRWNAISHQINASGAEVVSVDNFHPLMVLRLADPSQIAALRRSPFVEFIEPASFEITGSLMGSCGSTTPRQTGRTDTYGDIVPYTLDAHSVTQAWSVSAGAGITIGLVDTGVSVFQMQLGARFDQGQSTGRTIQYDYTNSYNGSFGEPRWHDGCGHGTKTLGIATAPRDGQNIVGVAYQANAFAIRALNGTVALGHFDEIREAIRRAADQADIISMSFGWSWGDSGVANVIREYYYNQTSPTDRLNLFVAAAGTSPFGNISGVVFPAEMPEVLAVTGTYDGVTPCDICHYGPELDFASYTAGQTTGPGLGSIDAAGGSSGAAPLLAGIAALVWSRHPTMSRDNIVARLRAAASRNYPNSQVGYGIVNAQMAVGPAPPPPPPGGLSVTLSGPTTVPQDVATEWRATVSGWGPTPSYFWQWAYQCPEGQTNELVAGSGSIFSSHNPMSNNLGDTCDPAMQNGGSRSWTTITPPKAGTIRIYLRVSNDTGAEMSRQLTVTVQ